jgi:hypothetical protein
MPGASLRSAAGDDGLSGASFPTWPPGSPVPRRQGRVDREARRVGPDSGNKGPITAWTQGPNQLQKRRYQHAYAAANQVERGIKDWPEMLAGDEVLATAILDRLLHRRNVLNIKGKSYRLRELEQAAGERA